MILTFKLSIWIKQYFIVHLNSLFYQLKICLICYKLLCLKFNFIITNKVVCNKIQSIILDFERIEECIGIT